MVVMMTEVMMVMMIHSHADATVMMMMVVVVADLNRDLRQPSCVICPRLCKTRIIGFQ